MAKHTFVMMRTCLFFPLLVTVIVASAQQPDTVHLPAGGVYSYIVGVHNKKGVYSGHVEYFDSAGTVRMRGSANRGKWEGLVEYFDSTGVLQRKSIAQSGKLNGVSTDYWNNGQAWRETPFTKGKANGTLKVYHANGQVTITAPYEDGRMSGEWMVWDTTGAAANGNVLIEGPAGGSMQVHCVEGRPEGKMVSRRMDGQFSVVGWYRAGLPVDDFIYYNSNGTPVRKDTYKQGRFVKSVPLNLEP